MQKKTRSRLNNKLSQRFCIAIFICLTGAAASFLGFYKNFTATLSKLNEEPIATISFKYKTAQRKFLERLVWDRLKQESPLYNGDTIHTADSAEATITFTDGNRIELFESTMIQIWSNTEDGGQEAVLTSGSAFIETDEENGNNVKVSTPGISNLGVAVGTGAAVNIGVTNGGYVQVVTGQAAITNEEGNLKTISTGDAVSLGDEKLQIPQIVVTSPSPNKKFLYHSEALHKVEFAWKTSNLPEHSDLILDISTDKNFETISDSRILFSAEKLILNLKPGSYYWRIRSSSKNSENTFTVGSRFQIIQSLPPSLIAPVQDYEYSYRTKKPAVRLIWSEANAASSYRLVIADNAKLRNPIITQRTSTNSTIISTLAEGTYFWQVTPYYSINKTGFSNHSEIKSFIVSKNGVLESPLLLSPAENSVIDNNKDANPSFFSWKQDNEAVNYTVEFSQNENFKGNTIRLETINNYITFSKNIPFGNGKWFWRVYLTDREGNTSPSSDVGSFYAMEGKPFIKTIEPADNYRVAGNLVPDMTFTWKKNIPEFMETTLRIFAEGNNSVPVISSNAAGFSASGFNLPEGTYSWKLVSKSRDTDFTIETPVRSFEILPSLPAPVIREPVRRAIARESKPFKYYWEDVKDADYYKLSVYKKDSGAIVYEDVIYDSSIEVDMFNAPEFEDKAFYRWELQAKSNGIPGIISRRSGLLAEAEFQLIKLRPVEIIVPKKNTVIDGLEAALNKIKVSWRAVDTVASAQIVISRKDSAEPVYVYPAEEEMKKGVSVAPESVLMKNPDLRNGGDYEIIVFAKTLDGIDISNTDAKYKGEFSVTPVKPLEAANNLVSTPADFNAEYLSNLKNPRTIKLSWTPVKNATDYILEVVSKNKVIVHQEISGKNSYEINWLELIKTQSDEKIRKSLYNGKFSWSVEAIRKIDTDNDGIPDTDLQPGLQATGSFQTSIPAAKPAKGKGAKNPYGK